VYVVWTDQFGCLGIKGLTTFDRRQISWDRLSPAPGSGRDLYGGSFQRVSTTSGDDDIGAFISQTPSDSLADATASAGDNRDFAFQLHDSSVTWSERG